MQVLSHIVYSWSLFLITFYMDIELCHTVYCTLLHLYIAFTNDFPLLSSTFFMAKVSWVRRAQNLERKAENQKIIYGIIYRYCNFWKELFLLDVNQSFSRSSVPYYMLRKCSVWKMASVTKKFEKSNKILIINRIFFYLCKYQLIQEIGIRETNWNQYGFQNL